MSERVADPSPFLVGDKIVLRGLREADLSGNYFRWFDDAEVTRWNSHHRLPNTKDRMESFFRRMGGSQSDLVLAIELRATHEHVGNIALHGIQWVDSTAEFGIIIGERIAWGKGVGKEASVLLLRHAFDELNLHRVYCGTSEDNEGMRALARFMGMVEEGRRREAMWKRGRYRDIIEYGVLRGEFCRLHPVGGA
jgi:RimJ/RimL family protein N-acetyltransferase